MVGKLNLDWIISSIASNNREIIKKCKFLGNIEISSQYCEVSERKIQFSDNPFNILFLKRPQTSEIIIHSKFSFNSLPGEVLAKFDTGKPALSYYKGSYLFNFDIFYSIQFYLNEKIGEISNGFWIRQILNTYWRLPKHFRLQTRKIIRKKRTRSIKPPNHFLGVIVNVLSKILENCFRSNGYEIMKSISYFTVTHDIDTRSCYEQGITFLREIEKQLKIPATVFLVPFGREYHPDKKILENYLDEDFEIALHGYSHDGLLLRQGQNSFEKKIAKALKFFNNAEVEISGFRSPWVLRNEFLLESLCKLGFLYDTSSPDKDTLSTTRPLIGLNYNRPIIRTIDLGNSMYRRIIQLPISYPQDVKIL